MINEKYKYMVLWILALIPMVLTAIFYSKLPQQIPMHWNIAGEVDRMSDKFPGAFILPAVTLLIPLLMTFMPRIDPRKDNYAVFKKTYYWLQLCIVMVFVCINIFVILTSLGYSVVRVDMFMKFIIGVLIAAFGNHMPKLKHNYFVGIKTPWTLSSEKVWFSTHRIGGTLWFIAGIFMVILSFIPGRITAFMYFAVIISASLIPIIYSYFAYRKHIKSSNAS